MGFICLMLVFFISKYNMFYLKMIVNGINTCLAVMKFDSLLYLVGGVCVPRGLLVLFKCNLG